MTIRLTTLTLMVALSGCVESLYESDTVSRKSATPTAFNASGAPVVEFNLPDMMCEDGCARAVKDILEKQLGVRDVQVDFEAKTATVAIEEGTFSSERTLAELVDKGFDNSKLSSDSSISDEAASSAATAAEDE
jgi:copper chaperone CopZ